MQTTYDNTTIGLDLARECVLLYRVESEQAGGTPV